MARDFLPTTFFRRVPNPLLGQYFQEKHSVLTEIAFDDLEENSKAAEVLYQAFSALPEPQASPRRRFVRVPATIGFPYRRGLCLKILPVENWPEMPSWPAVSKGTTVLPWSRHRAPQTSTKTVSGLPAARIISLRSTRQAPSGRLFTAMHTVYPPYTSLWKIQHN